MSTRVNDMIDHGPAAGPTEESGEAPAEQRRPRPTRWVKRLVIGVVVLIALVYGAIFFYANVLNDAPDALDGTDLSAALADDDAEPAAALTGFDGVWVPTAASQFGYRVDEVLAGVNVTAVGRSNEIDGTLTILGTTADVEVTVQIENIVSDDSRRDGQFRGRIMDATNFPTATFRTTEPIDFGTIPADGKQITATAVGELTLKGTTQAVEFQVTAQADGDNIGVLGNIPVRFEDYGIANPSNAGVKTEDDGLLEFVLVFAQR